MLLPAAQLFLLYLAASTAVQEVTTLSRERRIAVAIFSLSFLWTTLVVCGVPIIRAFRSRRRPPSPPWYI